MTKKYSRLFVNGRIYTEDDNRTVAEALAIEGDKIAFVGSNADAEALKADAEEVIDLTGKTMLPGFVDTHLHLYIAGIEATYKILLYDLTTEEEYLDRIRAFVEAHPEMDRYEGVGWINPAFGASGSPSRHSLDAICADKPIILDSGDHHSAWANTKAMEVAGITKDTVVPEGNIIEREADGTPSGTFREVVAITMLNPARVRYTKEQFKDAIRFVQSLYASYGTTTILDALIPMFDDEFLDALIEMDRDGELIGRIRGAFQGLENDAMSYFDKYRKYRQLASGDKLKFDQVKIVTDGVVEGKTGYMLEPYEGEESYRGEAIWKADVMAEFAIAADNEDYDIHFHAIGDAATEMMLDCMDKVVEANGAKDRRPVCTHMQIVAEKDYERIRDHNFVVASDPYWFFKAPGYFYGLEVPYLGKRAEHEYPMKTFFDMGLVVSAASDFSVTPEPYPPRGMQIAVTRVGIGEDPDDILWPEERVTINQMVDAFTRNGAYCTRDEDIIGSLEPGKKADLLVMDDDLFEVENENIHKVQVEMTICDGKVIYTKNQ